MCWGHWGLSRGRTGLMGLKEPHSREGTERYAQFFLTNHSLEVHSGFCGHRPCKQSVTKGIPWWFCS